jgi:hypothetical protein
LETNEDEISSTPATDQDQQKQQQQLGLPEEYVAPYIPPAPEPREYLPWKIHGINLLVGSDALIYRSSTSDSATTTTTTSTAMTVRVVDAVHMRAMLQQHQAMIQTGTFVADHQLAKLQQMGRPSYAEAAARQNSPASSILKNSSDAKDDGNDRENLDELKAVTSNGDNNTLQQRQMAVGRSFAAPYLEQVQLQTCIVPIHSEPSSVGRLLFIKGTVSCAMKNSDSTPGSSPPLSPVSTVLDTYLDIVMANVPQLALCLREKGFIQSVKLLHTDEIPSRLMQPSTLDTSVPF